MSLMEPIYLDNNATTRPDEEVVDAVHEANQRYWANPSSAHRFGQQVRSRVDLARAELARLINGRERELTLLSGATEANNLILRGLAAVRDTARRPRKTTVTTPIEHSAIREPAEQLEREGYRVVRLGVSRAGLVDADELAAVLNEQADEVALVSVHWANNETGVIQPIERIGERCRAARVPFHTDATQAVGKLPVDVDAAPVDALSLSAHKFHGPKGVGALWTRSTLRFRPQVLGGPQERERRGGTENVPAIVGAGVAARLARQWLVGDGPAEVCRLRDRFERTVMQQVDHAEVNGADAPRMVNTTNIGFPPLEAEALLVLLSEWGVCVSAGAACSSGSLEPSPVLLAMGVPDPVAHGSVRFSLSRQTTEAEVDRAGELVVQAVDRLRRSMPAA